MWICRQRAAGGGNLSDDSKSGSWNVDRNLNPTANMVYSWHICPSESHEYLHPIIKNVILYHQLHTTWYNFHLDPQKGYIKLRKMTQKIWPPKNVVGKTSEVCFLMYFDKLNPNLKSVCCQKIPIMRYQISWLCLSTTVPRPGLQMDRVFSICIYILGTNDIYHW
jgi:hypothetical protein